MNKSNYRENKMKRHIVYIIPIMLAFTALVPTGALASMESEDEEEQNDASNNYYTIEEEGQTVRVYPDGRHVIEETGECYYRNSEGEIKHPCE